MRGKSRVGSRFPLSDRDPFVRGANFGEVSEVTWRQLNRIFFVAGAAGAVWFVQAEPNHYVVALGVVCTLIGSLPIFQVAFMKSVQRQMTMEFWMIVAIVFALVVGKIFAALVITELALFSEMWAKPQNGWHP
jgi:hypothetical protein